MHIEIKRVGLLQSEPITKEGKNRGISVAQTAEKQVGSEVRDSRDQPSRLSFIGYASPFLRGESSGGFVDAIDKVNGFIFRGWPLSLTSIEREDSLKSRLCEDTAPGLIAGLWESRLDLVLLVTCSRTAIW